MDSYGGPRTGRESVTKINEPQRSAQGGPRKGGEAAARWMDCVLPLTRPNFRRSLRWRSRSQNARGSSPGPRSAWPIAEEANKFQDAANSAGRRVGASRTGERVAESEFGASGVFKRQAVGVSTPLLPPPPMNRPGPVCRRISSHCATRTFCGGCKIVKPTIGRRP